MRAFGNLMNKIMEESAQLTPSVGDGATVCSYSDRKAATIIQLTENTITVQFDKAVRTDDYCMSDCQTYEYTVNPEGVIITFRMNKAGRFVNTNYSGIIIGWRDHYHDFSF